MMPAGDEGSGLADVASFRTSSMLTSGSSFVYFDVGTSSALTSFPVFTSSVVASPGDGGRLTSGVPVFDKLEGVGFFAVVFFV